MAFSFLKKLGRKPPESTKKLQVKRSRPLASLQNKTNEKVSEKTSPQGNVKFSRSIGLSIHMTEDSVKMQENRVVVFRVNQNASKFDVMRAIREQYGVIPRFVRTARQHPKRRNRAQTHGRTTYWKKAYVTVDDVTSLISGS